MKDERDGGHEEGVVVGDDVDGLGSIVGNLFAGNLEDATRRALLKGSAWSVAVDVYDADSIFVISLGGAGVRIAKESAIPSQLVIRLSGDNLLEIPETPLWAGLPDPRSMAGRSLLKKVLVREVRITGLLRHPMLLRRFLKVLNTV